MAAQPNDRKALADLGDRLARHRLTRNRTQSQLAKEAGVSTSTVVRLENGESTQLTNLVRVLRALGLLGNIEILVPAPLASPVEALKAKSRERRRASPAATPRKRKGGWTWGDEQPARKEES